MQVPFSYLAVGAFVNRMIASTLLQEMALLLLSCLNVVCKGIHFRVCHITPLSVLPDQSCSV